MQEQTNITRIYWIIMAILGGLLFMGSGLTGIVSVAFLRNMLGPTVVMVVGACAAGTLLGVGLAWGALRAITGHGGRSAFSKLRWLGWVLLSLLAWIWGLLLPLDAQNSWAFGLLHMTAMLFPALLVISLVARFTGPDAALNWRQTLVGIFGGASAVALAFPVELVGLILSGVLSASLAMLIPGGSAEIDRLMAAVDILPILLATEDTVMLSSYLLSPLVITTMGLTLSVITPLIEELGKALILIFVYKPDSEKLATLTPRGRLARAFMWGAACGLGFAIIEGVGNGAAALGTEGGWTAAVLTRMLATIMHVFASGLVGLGWGLAREYKWWWLPVMYALAVLLHGLWNANALVMMGGALMQEINPLTGQILSVAGVIVQVLFIILTTGSIVAIPGLLREKKAVDVA